MTTCYSQPIGVYLHSLKQIITPTGMDIFFPTFPHNHTKCFMLVSVARYALPLSTYPYS